MFNHGWGGEDKTGGYGWNIKERGDHQMFGGYGWGNVGGNDGGGNKKPLSKKVKKVILYGAGGVMGIGAIMSIPVPEDLSGIGSTLTTAAGVAAAGGAGYLILKGRQWFKPDDSIPILIVPGQEKVDMQKVWRMTQGMAFAREKLDGLIKGRVWVTWRIIRDEKGKIHFYCLAPADYSVLTEKKIRIGLPDAYVKVDKHYRGITFLQKGGRTGFFRLGSSRKAGHTLDTSLENVIGDIISFMPKESVIDIRFSPTDEPKSERTEEQGKKADKPEEKPQYFTVAIHLWAKDDKVKPLGKQLTQYTKQYNEMKLWDYYVLGGTFNPLRYRFVTPPPWARMKMTDAELAPLLAMPRHDHPVRKEIDTRGAKLMPADHELKGGQITLGQVDDIGRGRNVSITFETATNHMVISGKSGAGKDSALIRIMDDFLEKWCDNPDHPGFTLNDPHLDTILLVINRLIALEEKGKDVPWDRVDVLDFGDAEYPPAFNLLHKEPGDNIDQIFAEASEIILSAHDGNLSQSAEMLDNALITLLADDEPHTIMELRRLFRSNQKQFRAKLLQNLELQNPIVYDWWVTDILPELQKQESQKKEFNIDPIKTRINPFLKSKQMQRIYCQKENALDVKRVFQQGRIVLINYKGASDAAFKLTSSWLVNRYMKEAKKRSRGQKEHFLIFNEAQLFEVEKGFAKITNETRKFGLGLIILTQNIENLSREFKRALKTNTGAIISLNQVDGAKVMSELMREKFTPQQLGLLQKVRDEQDRITALEAAVWSNEGSANIVVPPPAFIWEGERTGYGSTEEEMALDQAKARFKELQRRSCKHYLEVDADIYEQVTGKKYRNGLQLVDETAAAAEE